MHIFFFIVIITVKMMLHLFSIITDSIDQANNLIIKPTICTNFSNVFLE